MTFGKLKASINVEEARNFGSHVNRFIVQGLQKTPSPFIKELLAVPCLMALIGLVGKAMCADTSQGPSFYCSIDDFLWALKL